MKKLIALFLAGALCISMTGCNSPIKKGEEGQTKSARQSTASTPSPLPSPVLRAENGMFAATAKDVGDFMDRSFDSEAYKISKVKNKIDLETSTFYILMTENNVELGLVEDTASENLTHIAVRLPAEYLTSASKPFFDYIYALIKWADPQAAAQNGGAEYINALKLDNIQQFTPGSDETYEKNNITYRLALNEDGSIAFSLRPSV